MFSQLVALIKTSRPGFWPTHLWFFLLPFGQQDMFGQAAFWWGCVYVCFPLGLLLYGWNDVGDAATDAANPRKDSWLFGARPEAALRRRLPWLIAAAQLPFVVVFVLLAGSKMVLWFAAMVMANALYNGPAFGGFKRWAGLDLLNQVGYLLVFVLASWLCQVPQLSYPVLGFSALFAMHSHLFGQLMDVDQDREAGRRSTAVVLGVRTSKGLLCLMLLTEAAIAFSWFHGPFVAAFMLAGALFFLVDWLVGPPRYSVMFSKVFFLGWNLIVLLTMYFIWQYGLFVRL